MPREPLEAIVLVGGQGTRLRPLTLSAPKPLLPTAGVPFLAHLLARAAAGGVTHVVLATCYKSEMFAASLRRRLGVRAVHRLRPGGRAAGHRRRDPQRRRLAARQRPRRPGRGAQLRHPVRARPGRPDRPARQDRRRGDPAPGRGGRPVPVRRGADRRFRPRDRVPGEDAGPGDQPDQRRLLRVPARGHRPDPGRPPGLGRAGDVPGPDRVRAARHGLPRVGVLARRRDAPGLRARLVRPGARAAARARGARPGRARAAARGRRRWRRTRRWPAGRW